MIEQKWLIPSLTAEQQAVSENLSKALNISRVSADMLVRRGQMTPEAARAFIRPNLNELHDPFLFNDMQVAVERLDRALREQEPILVYGDYDVDGTTAVAVVYKFLRQLTTSLDFYIPNRYEEGYGVSMRGVDYAAENGIKLVIALDCGIKDIEEIAYAKSKGIDFIVCDHHLPGEQLPDAVAVIDAKRVDSTYPYSGLSGCGVGFKFLQAYCQYKQKSSKVPQFQSPLESNVADLGTPFNNGTMERSLYENLELLALSIACDIVPMTGENRTLAYYGLKQMREKPSTGMRCLMERAGVEVSKIDSMDLGFKIGPRINACGRMKSGRDAVQLLLTESEETARALSEDINNNNEDRRQETETIAAEAMEMLQNDAEYQNKYSTVVCGKDWLKGVVGIVASRLIDSYYRPTIVLSESDGVASGSARSVGGFDIYSAIDSCSDLLDSFGGHIFAAGLSMKAENVPEFKRRFEEYVANHILPEQTIPVLKAEAEIHFGDITNQFYRIIECLEPFGPENERPVFVTRNVRNYRYSKAVGKDNKHLKLDVTDGTGSLQGIAFGFGELAPQVNAGAMMDVCYELGLNSFNGHTSIQMMVKDIKIHN